MFAALSILANLKPLSPEIQTSLFTIGGVLMGVVAVLIYFRRNPPLEAQLAAFRAAIATLQKSVDQLATSARAHATHAAEIADLQQEVNKLRSQRDADQQTQRSYIAKNTRELHERIGAVEASINRNFQTLERALGRIEGQITSR